MAEDALLASPVAARGLTPIRIVWTFVLLLLMLALPAQAVEPDEIMADAKLESRARVLSGELRCLVCQNQSIDDSNAPLARDLRLLVRERLKAGDSDDAVMKFVVDRYGTYVLLRPPVGASTLLLWLGPSAMLLATMLFLVFKVRRDRIARETKVEPLTKAEAERLELLLGDKTKA